MNYESILLLLLSNLGFSHRGNYRNRAYRDNYPFINTLNYSRILYTITSCPFT